VAALTLPLENRHDILVKRDRPGRLSPNSHCRDETADRSSHIKPTAITTQNDRSCKG
jgi:hypothetical protein